MPGNAQDSQPQDSSFWLTDKAEVLDEVVAHSAKGTLDDPSAIQFGILMALLDIRDLLTAAEPTEDPPDTIVLDPDGVLHDVSVRRHEGHTEWRNVRATGLAQIQRHFRAMNAKVLAVVPPDGDGDE